MNKEAIVKKLYDAFGTDSGILFGIKEKSIVETIVGFTLKQTEELPSPQVEDEPWLDNLILEEKIEAEKKNLRDFISERIIHKDSLDSIMDEIENYKQFSIHKKQ